MSRNSKNAQRIQRSKEMSESRKNGHPGPSQTQPKHGKKRAWWQLGDYRTFARGKPTKSHDDLSTSQFIKRAAKPAPAQA